MRLNRISCLLVVVSACGTAEAPPPEAGIHLRHLATSDVVPYAPPMAVTHTLAAPEADRVCLVDGYETRIVCGDLGWENTVVLGRKGAGPGELLGTGPLFPMPGGGLAFVDGRNSRVTLFSENLDYDGSVPVTTAGSRAPPGRDSILPVVPVAAGVQSREIHLYHLGRAGPPDTLVLDLTPDKLGFDGFAPSVLLRTPERWLLRGTGGRFVWLSADARDVLGVIPPPAYDPGYPDDLDREDQEEDLRAMFGMVRESDLDRFLSRPRHPHPRGHIAQVDHLGRLWILGNRPGKGVTFIEVYRDTTHLGVVPVPGGLLAFRIADSTLVALTRPVRPDADGMRPRRLVWYAIEERAPGR